MYLDIPRCPEISVDVPLYTRYILSLPKKIVCKLCFSILIAGDDEKCMGYVCMQVVLPIKMDLQMHRNEQAVILQIKYHSESMMPQIEVWLQMICIASVCADQE